MTSSAYHPFGYGQGFATTLMIPAADRAGMHTYKFIAHETAHQWWVIMWCGVLIGISGSVKG